MTPAALLAALPPVAARALLLARQFDHSVDPGAAWIAHTTHPHATPGRLAGYLRSQARRNRRAGGAHGPSAFASIDDDDAPLLAGDCSDPADTVAAAQQIVATRPGLAAALRQREGASDTAALAARDHVSRRRAQQALAARKRAEDAGQGDLFGGSDE